MTKKAQDEKDEAIKQPDITDSVVAGNEADDDVKSAGIEVDIDAKPAAKKEEPQYVRIEDLQKLQKQFDGISKTIRYTERLKDVPTQIEELKRVVNSRFTSTAEKTEAKDELDEMLEKGDWRTPVERLAEKKFQSLMQERDRAWQEDNARKQRLSALEAEKKVVREKYPDIDDPDSEISQRYQKVIADKPQYLSSEFGPTLAMRDMEDDLRQEGRLDEFTKKAVEKEVLRQTRAGVGSLPRTTASPNGSKIMLTKEQKEFCDSHNLKYQDYAKFVRHTQRSPKEGVEA